jgi:uncharacterized protein (DUF488 family)
MDAPNESLVIYTIGHSSHSAETFLELLRVHGIRQLADVRSLPQSRRHPQFGKVALADALEAAGIVYRHFQALGGMRRPRPDSINTALLEPAFRGYADHMQSTEFDEGIRALDTFARCAPTTVMCAESLWWQCHRRLLADALFVRNVIVQHIVRGMPLKAHELSEFGRPDGARVIYPGLLSPSGVT